MPINKMRLNMKNVMETFDTKEDASRWIAMQYLLNA